MGPILAAVVLFIIYWVVPIPYPLNLIVLVAAVIALVWGIFILFRFYGPGAGEPTTVRRRSRWY